MLRARQKRAQMAAVALTVFSQPVQRAFMVEALSTTLNDNLFQKVWNRLPALELATHGLVHAQFTECPLYRL